MSHTRVVDCNLALWVRQFEPECSNIEQENTQEAQQENNLLEGAQPVALSEETTEMPQAVQLVQPKEAIDNMAEIERQYRETIEQGRGGE